MGKQPKYRPVLSGAQITRIMELVTDSIEEIDLAILKTLAPFEAKIKHNAIVPAYVGGNRVTLADSIGLNSLTPPKQWKIQIGDTDEIITCTSKEDYWEKCYWKFVNYREHCLEIEIDAAKEHMYLNDLMSPREREEFELGMDEEL